MTNNYEQAVARLICSTTLIFALAACAAGSADGRHAVPVPAVNAAPADASYDWHVLVLAPFGMRFKDSPMALHEVLLFHDEAHAASDVENKDCYAIDRSAPRFMGREPDPYLLCFDHDRLSRIEATVHLATDAAPAEFARACALWLMTSAPAPIGSVCEGRDGRTDFSGRLALVPGEAAAAVSMTLTSPPGDTPLPP